MAVTRKGHVRAIRGRETMSLSMSAASAGLFRRALTNLASILKKGEASAEARKFDPSVL